MTSSTYLSSPAKTRPGHRSEERLIENTQWAQWSVCHAIRRAACYWVSFWYRSFIQITARWAWTVGCQSKSQGISFRADCLRYRSVADKIFVRYRNIALSIQALICTYSIYSIQSYTSCEHWQAALMVDVSISQFLICYTLALVRVFWIVWV